MFRNPCAARVFSVFRGTRFFLFLQVLTRCKEEPFVFLKKVFDLMALVRYIDEKEKSQKYISFFGGMIMPLFLLTLALREPEYSAIERLYREYAPLMKRVALSVLKNEEDALDAVHDATIELIDWLRIHSEKELSVGLIAVIVKRRALDIYRRAHRHAPLPPEDLYPTPTDPSTDVDAHEISDLIAAIGALRADQQQILHLYAIHGLSHREIGKALGISPAAAQVRVSRAKLALKKVLEGMNYEID